MLVADGTRRVTLDQALELQKRVAASLAPRRSFSRLNKSDLATQWEIDEARMTGLTDAEFHRPENEREGRRRSGRSFRHLARQMVSLPNENAGRRFACSSRSRSARFAVFCA